MTYLFPLPTFSEIQRAFAHFFQQLSHAEACWYSVTKLTEATPTLSSLFNTSEDKTSHMLELAGFGWVRSSTGQLRFSQKSFDDFINTYHLQEVVQLSRFTISRKDQKKPFILVGRKKVDCCVLPGCGVDVTPPRIHFLSSASSELKTSVQMSSRTSSDALDPNIQAQQNNPPLSCDSPNNSSSSNNSHIQCLCIFS